MLPLSIGGYDIQRLPAREQRWRVQCEDITYPIIEYLFGRGEYPAPLGPLRLRAGMRIAAITDQSLYPPPGHSQPLGENHSQENQIQAALTDMLASSPVSPSTVAAEFDMFIQELTTPAEQASVEVGAEFMIAMAMSQGKVTKVVPAFGWPLNVLLRAPSIDTIVVYVIRPVELRICVYERPAEKGPDPVWASAPYIAKGLTLPIHQSDPTLANPAQEYAKAAGRLMTGETLSHQDFAKLTAALRNPAAGSALGRSGERIVLVRADDTQGYEELPFDTQLAGLALHPKARRVLGFGFRDHTGLVSGESYMYRITGRFRAQDLTDTIYDVHRVPATTMVPAACSIGDLGLRFQTPVQVVLAPAPSATALHAASRRGIRIDTTGYDPSWFLPSLDSWSAIIDLPRPVTAVVLEVAQGHTFTYAGGLPWAWTITAPAPLPPGPVVSLTFAEPVSQLRLAGTGTLFAVRLPSGHTGVREVYAYTGPVRYAAEPLPSRPVILTAYNLQQPATAITGPIDESTPIAPRPAGLRLNWLPPAAGGLGIWPPGLDAGPPLDALAYKIQHRDVTPPATFGPWQPIAGDDNLTVGSRDDTAPSVRLESGCDLDALFPAVRPRSSGAGYALHLSDVLGETDPSTGQVLREQEPLGSYHQYEIESMDAVGRVSATSTLSNIVRLEKHIPPPLPVGPQPEPPLDGGGHLTAPPGPRARAIVAGAPGLTAADITLLGAHQNAILLEWGWRQAERDLDPTTAEFRVYSTVPPDVVEGAITAVTSAPPDWQLSLTTSLPLVADELAGQWITSNGNPFQVLHNDAGTTPTMLVQPSAAQPAVQPVPSPVTFGRPLAPAHQRPGGWDQRVAVYPLTAADTYRHVFYDLLNLSPAHPRDSLWVGVSAADAQPYVPDERTTGQNSNRPGNESGIVVCAVVARYIGQPEFSVPPPLGDVPEIVTDEPTGRQVLVSLDLVTLLNNALAAGTLCVLERCSADDILSRTSVANGQVVLTDPDGTAEVIVFANPGDEAAVIATLDSASPQSLPDKYLLHLVAGAATRACSSPGSPRTSSRPARWMTGWRPSPGVTSISSGPPTHLGTSRRAARYCRSSYGSRRPRERRHH